jgi:cysteine desulfurase/selenocysteine lyase
MGFEKLIDQQTAPAIEIWREYRDQFPVTRNLIYLNHAAVAPLSRRAAAAMQNLAQDVLDYGSLNYDQWLDAYEGVRVAAARLLGAERSEIALVKNTSEGIATVALGFDWSPGDKMVGFREEFPANTLPWRHLEATRDLRIEWLSIYDPLDRIDQACRGARLLAISFVNYLSGHRVDLQAMGEICRRQGCFFFVDAIQGLGAFPVDVEAARIDALAADGHKWMLGPEGCGILYVRRDRQDQIEPTEYGWTNIAEYANHLSTDMTLRPDAGRYECGTLNTAGCFGLRAAMELLLEADVKRVSTHVQALGDRIAAGVVAKGYQLACERTAATGAGIVTFRKPGVDNHTIAKALRDAGILAAQRLGWIRTAPHFYISPDDIDQVLDALPE